MSNLTCEQFDSEEAFCAYLRECGRNEANVAMERCLELIHSFHGRGKGTVDRLNRIYDSGDRVYEERFGEFYCPF